MAKEKKALEAKLPAEVAAKYNLKIIRPGKYNFHGFGEIDLRKVTLKEVETLIKKGFQFFEEKVKEVIEPEKAAAEKAAAEKLEEAKAQLLNADMEDMDYQDKKSLFIALGLEAENLKNDTITPLLVEYKENLES